MERRALGPLCLTFTSTVLAGCQPEDDAQQCGDTSADSVPGPPTLVSARMVEQTVVRLTFSEPLAALGGVDPASFRMSWVWQGGGYSGYDPYTSYYDPALALCLSSDACVNGYTEVVELRCAPGDPSSLDLQLERFPELICENITLLMGYYEDYTSPLFPHFDASIGTITDLDGEPLASISPACVSAPDGYLTVDGVFPNYPMRIPIECPPE